jgi:hypothetical protein
MRKQTPPLPCVKVIAAMLFECENVECLFSKLSSNLVWVNIQLAVLSISLQPDFASTCGMVKQKDRVRNNLVSLVSFPEPNRKLHEKGLLRTPK